MLVVPYDFRHYQDTKNKKTNGRLSGDID